MTSNSSLDTTTESASDIQFSAALHANRIKFGILLAFQLVSIPCFLWIFYQFLRQPQLRQSLHHHVILLLLIVSFLFVTVALPMAEAFLYRSHVYPESQIFCSFWVWLHYSINIVNLFLMGFASIERNWLIFHPWLVRGKYGKLFLHYCPLLFCLLCPTSFYFGAIFIYQCESYYDFTQLLCTWPCYFFNENLAYFDLFFNNYTPLLAIPIFCVMIYVRVLIQKRAMKQQVFKWNRDKKMILQLWAISSLYLGMWMPMQLAGLINYYWDPYFLVQAQIDYLAMFPYFIHMIYPFVILLTYPHEMLNFRRNAVVPHITVTGKRNIPANNH